MRIRKQISTKEYLYYFEGSSEYNIELIIYVRGESQIPQLTIHSDRKPSRPCARYHSKAWSCWLCFEIPGDTPTIKTFDLCRSTILTGTKLLRQENIRHRGTALSGEDHGQMSLRDGEPMTSESQLEINEQDILGSKHCHGYEESSNQVINEWFLDNVISFARSPAGSPYPGASSDDQDIPITRTTSPISPRNSAANSANSRFELIILNQPIEMGLDDFFEIWTRGIVL